MEKFAGVTLPTVGRFSLYEKKNYGWCTVQNFM
jgi:hypothetical protein